MRSIIKQAATLMAVGLLALGITRNAEATGTVAGTVITNTANLAYQVGGFNQTPTSAQVQVTVDRKINVTLSHTDGNLVEVSPGQTGAKLTFTITNSGNSPMRFALTPTALVTGSVMPFAGNPASSKASAANGTVYSDAGLTTPITDTGAVPMAIDATMTVYVGVTIPLTALDATQVVDTNTIAYKLEAKAVNENGSNFGTYASPNNLDAGAQYGAAVALNNVFADGTDTWSDTANFDGKASDRSGFLVKAPVLSIGKTSSPHWDPVNLLVSPKSIPLGVVEYVVTVQNAAGAGATAQNVTITDATPANLTFITSSTVVAGFGTGPGYGAGACAQKSTDGGSTWTDIPDSAYSAGTLTVNLGNIAAGSVNPASSVKLRYRVKIN